MPVQALSIDFWNTLVEARVNGRARQARRLRHLLSVAQAYRPETTAEEVTEAFTGVVRRFETVWKTRHCTPVTEELVRSLWKRLGVTVDPEAHAETVRLFQEGILHYPPALVEGAPEMLAWAAERYRLALISDTMFSPGRIIRRLLDAQGLLRHFDAFVFSDETGFSKPDVRAFERAALQLDATPETLAHIGDLRRTDVAGARRAGATAILFTGVHEDEGDGPEPDLILPHWRKLPDVL
ncbi:HAD family hydrolase [Rhodocaloribacter sp.]